MDLTKLREAIGADKNVTDDKLIEQAIAKLTEGKASALELSRTKATEADALKTRAETAERERDEQKAKVLELSRASRTRKSLDRQSSRGRGTVEPMPCEQRAMHGRDGQAHPRKLHQVPTASLR
jgi:hypothetical protein